MTKYIPQLLLSFYREVFIPPVGNKFLKILTILLNYFNGNYIIVDF